MGSSVRVDLGFDPAQPCAADSLGVELAAAPSAVAQLTLPTDTSLLTSLTREMPYCFHTAMEQSAPPYLLRVLGLLSAS